jgi:transposase
MRDELTDREWAAIKPMLPNKLPDGFWSLHHLLQSFRSLAAGGGLAQDYEHAGSRPRLGSADDRHVHCPGAAARCLHHSEQKTVNGPVTRRPDQQDTCFGRYQHLPVSACATAGKAHDNRLADRLLSRRRFGSMLLADRGYDADWIRALAARKGALANVPARRNRIEPISSAHICIERRTT